MQLPFTREQFLDNLKDYNQAVYPAQIAFYLIAAATVYFALRKTSAASNRVITAVLAFFWLWMGVVYHLSHFAGINKAAYLFGFLFITQGAMLFYMGAVKGRLSFHFRTDTAGITGAVFILYALVVYPILGYFNGHIYPAAPTFGLPCPTTIFTFGIFL